MTSEGQSDASKQALKDNGWAEGIVLFANPGSETSTRMWMMMERLKADGKGDYSRVVVDFNDKPLSKDKKTIGMKCDLYSTITDGRKQMPTLAIDGELFRDSSLIIKMLYQKHYDPDPAVIARIDEFIAIATTWEDCLKHWGWAAPHRNKAFFKDTKNYVSYGKGQKTLEWEKKTLSDMKAFLAKIDSELKPVDGSSPGLLGTGGPGGNVSATPADYVYLPTCYSLWYITGLDCAKNYPNFWAWTMDMKARKIPGSQEYLSGFPIFGKVVAWHNRKHRGHCCNGSDGFEINNSVYN